MKKYDDLVKTSPLFEGITKEAELSNLLNCIDGEIKRYRAGDTIVAEGEALYFLGNLLSGIAQEQNGDGSGAVTFDEGQLITGSFSEEKSTKAENAVIAKTDCTVLWVRWIRVSKLCNFACNFHKTALENLNRMMNDRKK